MLASVATPAWAHGFGQRYDLPIPLAYYLVGAAAVVALSFAILAFALRPEWVAAARRHRRIPLGEGAWLLARVGAVTLRAIGLALFLLVVAAGLVGNADPYRNIAPVLIWILGWVGVAFLSPLVGDLWRVVNPWDTLFGLAERIYRRTDPGRPPGLRWRYPRWVGVWPAAVLFVGFAWTELVWRGRDIPAALIGALLAYAALTLLGMMMFGRTRWLRRGEAFSLVFGIFSRFAPIVWPSAANRTLRLRAPAAGLLQPHPLPLSMVVLIVALLATVTFDGLLETPLWARIDLAVLEAPADSVLWTRLHLREDQAVRIARTLGLIGIVALFNAVFWLVCQLTAGVGYGKANAQRIAGQFATTLVPIALAYHVAHYASYLVIGGQYVIPLASDPFGVGWDLFGTAAYAVELELIGPRSQWTIALAAVVIGHVVAVYLAHVTALRIFPTRRAAVVRQIPMLLLMVGYTMVGLWILSQPIVEVG